MNTKAENYKKKIHEVEFIGAKPGKTFCNIYATRVMDNCGTPLPKDNNGNPLLCSKILEQLRKGTGNWKKYDEGLMAQKEANNGYSGVAITHDHIAVITPTDIKVNDIKDIHISQSGHDYFFDGTISKGWSKQRYNEIEFYVYK